MPVPWVKVNVGIPKYSHPIPRANEARAVDDHPKADIDIPCILPEGKPILDIGKRVSKPPLFNGNHPTALISGKGISARSDHYHPLPAFHFPTVNILS